MTTQQLDDFIEKFCYKDKLGRYPEMWAQRVYPQDVIKWIEELDGDDTTKRQAVFDQVIQNNS